MNHPPKLYNSLLSSGSLNKTNVSLPSASCRKNSTNLIRKITRFSIPNLRRTFYNSLTSSIHYSKNYQNTYYQSFVCRGEEVLAHLTYQLYLLVQGQWCYTPMGESVYPSYRGISGGKQRNFHKFITLLPCFRCMVGDITVMVNWVLGTTLIRHHLHVYVTSQVQLSPLQFAVMLIPQLYLMKDIFTHGELTPMVSQGRAIKPIYVVQQEQPMIQEGKVELQIQSGIIRVYLKFKISPIFKEKYV